MDISAFYHYIYLPFIVSFMVADTFDTGGIVSMHTSVIVTPSTTNKHQVTRIVIRWIPVPVINFHVRRRELAVMKCINDPVIRIPLPMNIGLPITSWKFATSQFAFLCV